MEIKIEVENQEELLDKLEQVYDIIEKLDTIMLIAKDLKEQIYDIANISVQLEYETTVKN
jgi:hypothetical protein